MNLVEVDQALRKLRLSGVADVLETRLLPAQTDQMAPIDLVAALVSDELQRREDRLLARRHKQVRFRDPDRSLEATFFFHGLAGVVGGLDGATVWQAVGVESGDDDRVELEALGPVQSRQGHARIAAGAWVRGAVHRAAVGDEGAEQRGTVLLGERLPTPLLEQVRVGDELGDVV